MRKCLIYYRGRNWSSFIDFSGDRNSTRLANLSTIRPEVAEWSLRISTGLTNTTSLSSIRARSIFQQQELGRTSAKYAKIGCMKMDWRWCSQSRRWEMWSCDSITGLIYIELPYVKLPIRVALRLIKQQAIHLEKISVHVCTQMRVCIRICTWAYPCVFVYTCVYTLMYMRTRVCTCLHLYVHVLMHIYTPIRVYLCNVYVAESCTCLIGSCRLFSFYHLLPWKNWFWHSGDFLLWKRWTKIRSANSVKNSTITGRT